jgi:hypothetical protein
MNTDLKTAIETYVTKSHTELNAFLIGKSKDDMIAMFNALLTTYINDKNSSTLREFVTVSLCGYQHSETKLGYNGYRQNTIGDKQCTEYCEVKPKNFNTNELEKFKNGERKGKPARLNGGGNFTDYTPARLYKNIKDNPHILVSGFIDGKLIYIFDFPFNTKDFVSSLSKQLEQKFAGGERKTGDYLRSASFSYKNYINCPVKLVYCLNCEELKKYENYIEHGLFAKLLELSK